MKKKKIIDRPTRKQDLLKSNDVNMIETAIGNPDATNERRRQENYTVMRRDDNNRNELDQVMLEDANPNNRSITPPMTAGELALATPSKIKYDKHVHFSVVADVGRVSGNSRSGKNPGSNNADVLKSAHEPGDEYINFLLNQGKERRARKHTAQLNQSSRNKHVPIKTKSIRGRVSVRSNKQFPIAHYGFEDSMALQREKFTQNLRTYKRLPSFQRKRNKQG